MALEPICAAWRRSFEAAGEAATSARKSSAFDEHASACANCREWLGVFAGELKKLDATPPAGFVDAVLARTTGAACARAADRLPPFVDGDLGEVDRRLIAGHVAHCADCAALVGALTRFGAELPALSEVRPIPSLVPVVLALTSRAVRNRVAVPANRILDVWRRLWLRPQFAYEGAYLGAFVLSVAFALSGGSARDLERQFAELAATPAQTFVDPAPWSALEQTVSLRSASFLRAAERVSVAFERIWTPENSDGSTPSDRSKTAPSEGDD